MQTVRAAAWIALALLTAAPGTAVAQASVPRAGQAGLTFSTQAIDHVGRLRDDGSRIACCGTTNVAAHVELEYGLTGRLAIMAGLPYVFAKYRGGPPPAFLPYLPVDSCHCLHSSFQDLEIGIRYALFRVRREMAVTPSVSVHLPTHDYPYAGEATVGFRLKQLGLGVELSRSLDFLVSGLGVDGQYEYTIVERPLGIAHNRSNIRLDVGYGFLDALAGVAILSWQRTHGGLRMPADVQPFPERYPEFHRLLRDNYFHAGGGVTIGWRAWSLSGSILRAVRGTNTHDVHVYTVSASRAFDLRR